MIGFYMIIGAIALASWLVSNTLKNKFKKYSNKRRGGYELKTH